MKTEGVLRPEDAALELGMSASMVRNQMRLGRFVPPIGYAQKSRTGNSYRYYIYRNMLDEYLHQQTSLTDEVRALRELIQSLKEGA